MMKVLYIGQYSEGTTSRMRADQMNNMLKPHTFNVVDTHIPFYNTNRVYRSLGFRFQKGPLIRKINSYVLSELKNLDESSGYDLVWIDKGIFLKKMTILAIKKITECLVHFTPDMAFYENKSYHFEEGIEFYDFVVTTKKAELLQYLNFVPRKKLIHATQGFSQKIHFPIIPFEKKENYIAFIGLAEKSRFEIAEHILDNNIHLKVAGVGWGRFAKKYKNNSFFEYYGKALYGTDYSEFISSASFGLGLLSKNFPELHTTRTFEIPACGTALLTERNEETSSFFDEDEVIFYSSPEEVIKKVKYYLENKDELQVLSRKGCERVHKEGYDYESVIRKILDQVLV